MLSRCVIPTKGYSSIDGGPILRNLRHDMPGVEINIKIVPALEHGPGGKRAFYGSRSPHDDERIRPDRH